MVNIRVFPHELVGEEITIVDSTNESEIGLTGKVVDETKITLKLETQNGEIKTILKQNATIKLKTGELIRGVTIAKRSEDRIKGK